MDVFAWYTDTHSQARTHTQIHTPHTCMHYVFAQCLWKSEVIRFHVTVIIDDCKPPCEFYKLNLKFSWFWEILQMKYFHFTLYYGYESLNTYGRILWLKAMCLGSGKKNRQLKAPVFPAEDPGSVISRIQGSNLDGGTDVGAIEECCYLACSPWLAQLAQEWLPSNPSTSIINEHILYAHRQILWRYFLSFKSLYPNKYLGQIYIKFPRSSSMGRYFVPGEYFSIISMQNTTSHFSDTDLFNDLAVLIF